MDGLHVLNACKRKDQYRINGIPHAKRLYRLFAKNVPLLKQISDIYVTLL